MSQSYETKVRPEKVEAVEKIKSAVEETQALVLTEYRGLTVNQLADLRSKLRDQGTSYRVLKNTLTRRAVTDLGMAELAELLTGPVAVAFCKEDPIAAAKVLATFAKDHPDLVIKGGVLDGRMLSAEEAKGLASVDSLDVSRAKIAGLLTAPLRQLMMLLEAPASRILYVLEQLGAREGAETQASPNAEAPASETDDAPAAEPAEASEAPAADRADAGEQTETQTETETEGE